MSVFPKSAMVAIVLSVAAFANADAFDPKQVPASAKWVVHLDMDAARDSKVWEVLDQHLSSDANFKQKVTEVKNITGMKFPDDLRDATVYGSDASELAAVVLIHAKVNRERTTLAVQMNPTYAAKDYGAYQVLSWEDKGKKMYGAFHDDSRIVIGRTQSNIETALNALDGKTESIGQKSPLGAGIKPQVLLYGAARELGELKQGNQPQSPVISQVENAWVSLSEKGNNAMVHANLAAKSPEVAEQIRTSMEGIRAMVGLSASGENADPNAKIAAQALATLNATTTDDAVQVEWPISVDLLRSFLDKAAAKKAGSGGAGAAQ